MDLFVSSSLLRPIQDPTFRLIGSEKIWELGAALTSRLQSFEAQLLTQEKNLAGLERLPSRYILSGGIRSKGKGRDSLRQTGMARAFSDDLRCRILQTYESGEVSLAELARRFGVSHDYVKKIRKHQLRYGRAGHLSA